MTPLLPAVFSRDHARPFAQAGRVLVCMALCVMLAACGFRLKGPSPLPFSTIYTNIDENSSFGAFLRRSILASSPGIQFVNDPLRAQVQLRQLSSTQNLRDISLDAQGRVEEYELTLEFTFQLTDAQNRVVLPPTTLRSVRELPYDDTIVQAKQGEIDVTFQNMRESLVERILYMMSSREVIERYEQLEANPDDVETAPSNGGPGATAPGASPGQPPASAPLWGAPTPGMLQQPGGF
jgi:LPS-assembly lipoprotein